MSSPPGRLADARACDGCVRRSHLLAELSGPLDFRAGDRDRLIGLLALEDRELLQALAGRRTAELWAWHERFHTGEHPPEGHVEAVCRHDARYPRGLRGAEAPRMLYVAGGVDRLAKLAAGPVVAIVGSTRASDYGLEMAKGLARGLAASGVTVAGGIGDGIARAAHAGALEAGAPSVAVLGGGLGAVPARRRSLCERARRRGCVVSELPGETGGRRWGPAASERIVAGLAALTVVVEAADTARELAPARIAQALGRAVAALPGRVTSPLSAGTHALLMDGARLVRGPGDVLDLLSLSPGPPIAEASPPLQAGVTPRLRATLERVGAGRDTPGKLAADGGDPEEILLRLSELELMGLLARGDGGRYVPRGPLPPRR
jgi:DNA processing protein